MRSSAACLILLSGLSVGVVALPGCTSDMQVLTYAKQSRQTGIRLYNEGNYVDAAGAFRNAIKQDPRDFRSHYYLGVSYEALKSYQQSIESYKSALDIMKTTYEGREDKVFRTRVINSLAAAVARSDNRSMGKDLIEKEAKSGSSAEAWYILGKIHQFSGDADSAIDAYNRAAWLEPKNFQYNKDYGLYLLQLGQNQKAEVPLKRAYAVDPADTQVSGALRQIGVVPGPSLKDEKDLVQPPLPRGPLPEGDLNNTPGEAPALPGMLPSETPTK